MISVNEGDDAKLIADFNDASKRALTIRIPAHAKNVALRGMKILNGTIFAASAAQDAIGLECLTNQSWLYSWKLMDLDIEHFARDVRETTVGETGDSVLLVDDERTTCQPRSDSAGPRNETS